MRFMELLDIAKEKTGGFGGDKLTELAASVNEALPIITQAGFILEQMQVTIGVPPKAILRARVVREITDQEYEALVEQVGEQVLKSVVAGTFLKAAALHRSFHIGSMQSNHIEIELSPLPAVRFLFVPGSAPAPNVPPAFGTLDDVRLVSK